MAEMRWFRAYGAFFDSPDWPMNLLSSAVCNLIPIIGPIVVTGWHCEVVESLHRNPDRVFPKFDWNRFGDYLGRGVWPFLVQLIVGFGAAFVLLAIMAAFGLVGGILTGASENPAPLLIALGVGMLVMMGLSFALQLVMMPMLLRAALTQQLGEAFSLWFVRDFIGRTWLQVLLVSLFLPFTGFFIIIAGELALCVGIYPAIAWVAFASWHLGLQCYELYLDRGGEPIPIKGGPRDDTGDVFD